MASGRMLRKKISLDKGVAELIDIAGAEAGLTYTWCLAHLDREGRIHGEPDVLKSIIFPRVKKITEKHIEKTLDAAHQLGLIQWYEVDGERFISFTGFQKNQKLNPKREAASEIPPPPKLLPQVCESTELMSYSGVTPELVRSNTGELRTNVCLSKDKISKDKVKIKNKVSKSLSLREDKSIPSSKNSAVADVIEHYKTYHPKSFPKVTSKRKEWKLIQERLESFGVEILKDAIDGMHRTPHNLGVNDRRTQYLDLELCMRNDQNVERFARNKNAPIPPSLKEFNRRVDEERAKQEFINQETPF